MSQVPTLGRIVHYTLTEYDAARINRRRDDAHQHLSEHQLNATGVVVHSGNPVTFGDVFPLVITRVWTPGSETSAVNGQLLLDGNDTLWVTSTSHGEGQGRFVWPPRA